MKNSLLDLINKCWISYVNSICILLSELMSWSMIVTLKNKGFENIYKVFLLYIIYWKWEKKVKF